MMENKTYEDECREEEAKYRAGVEKYMQDWPAPSGDGKALAVRIFEINGWAHMRHQNRGISVRDHNRYETDRMSQILEVCRESKSPWGQVILSALPDGCIKETDELAALLAKQRGEAIAEPVTGDKTEPTANEGTEITCPACSQTAHLALRRGDPCGGIGTCAFCGTEQGADGYYVGVTEAYNSGFVCQRCAREHAPKEYLKFVEAQRDRYARIYAEIIENKRKMMECDLPF